MTGHGHGAEKSMPRPSRNVRTSSTVMGRVAGTVSPSRPPRPSTSTRRLAISGSRSSIGSSSRSRHSSTRISAATAVIGLVIDAMRKSESGSTARPSSRVSVPATPTSTSPSRAASQASPRRCPARRGRAITSCSRASRDLSNPLIASTLRPVTFDAVVVGAGVSGLYQLHRLRELGHVGARVRSWR